MSCLSARGVEFGAEQNRRAGVEAYQRADYPAAVASLKTAAEQFARASQVGEQIDSLVCLAGTYQARRDQMLASLAASPFRVFRPEGAFFVLASFAPSDYPSGRACCQALARDVGVVPVPLDTFFVNADRAQGLVRFTFCIRGELLLRVDERLSRMKAAANRGVSSAALGSC